MDYLADYDKAMECLNKVLAIRMSAYGENHPEVASCYNNLGVVYFNLGDDHPVTVKVKEKISEVQTKMKGSDKE